MTNETDRGHVTVDLGDRPFVRIVVPTSGDSETDAGAIKSAIRSVLAALDVPAEDVAAFKALLRDSTLGKRAPAPPQERQAGAQRGGGNRRGGRQGGAGQSRADRFQKFPDETCDICNGPVGIYPRIGNMQSDKLVCLGRCKDDDYVHTVRWLDEDEDLPF